MIIVNWKFCVILTFLLFIPNIVTAQNYVDYEVLAEDYSFEKIQGFDIINIEGYGKTHNIGEPMLPSKIITVELPRNAKISSISILDKQYQLIRGIYDILPAKIPKPRCNCQENTQTTLEKKSEIYEKNVYYPSVEYKLEGEYFFNNKKIALIRFYPVRYNPITKRILMTNSVKIRVYYDYGFTILDTTKNSLQVGNYDYVFITDDSLVEEVNPLIDRKNDHGIKSKIVNLSFIYSNYDGIDNAEKIRNFIADAHNTWETEYIVLGGDAEIIPVRLIYTASWGLIPSDHYYAGLDGNWDDDGDGLYGEIYTVNDEIVDEVDWFPEVYVGRIPVNTETQMTNVINKIINYESNLFDREDNFLLLAAMLLPDTGDSGITKDYIVNNFMPFHYIENKLYARLGNLNFNTIKNNLNSGYKLINFNGHGNEYGLYNATGPKLFENPDISSLSNINKLPIFYAAACRTGNFVYTDSFGEKMLTASNGGAAVFIGATTETFGVFDEEMLMYDGEMDWQFWKEYFNVGNPSVALYNAKINYLINNGVLINYDRIEMLTYNVLGDPLAVIGTVDGSIHNPVNGQTIYQGSYRILVKRAGNDVVKVELSIDDNQYIDITGNFDGIYYYYDWGTKTLEGIHTLKSRETDDNSMVGYSELVSVEIKEWVYKGGGGGCGGGLYNRCLLR